MKNKKCLGGISRSAATLLEAYSTPLMNIGRQKMVALRAADGKVMWEAPHYTSGYQSPQDLLVAGRAVLSPFSTWLKANDPKNNHVVATDLMTGRPLYDNKPDVDDPVWFIHHRCHPSKATLNYLLMSKEGVEFVDLKTGHWTANHWVRGGCIYGVLPCNGLLYAPPHPCICYITAKLNGFWALAPADGGTVSPPLGAHTVNVGVALTVRATPAKGFVFSHWWVDGAGTIADPRARETTATLTGDATVTAYFAREKAEIPVTTGSVFAMRPSDLTGGFSGEVFLRKPMVSAICASVAAALHEKNIFDSGSSRVEAQVVRS